MGEPAKFIAPEVTDAIEFTRPTGKDLANVEAFQRKLARRRNPETWDELLARSLAELPDDGV